MTPIKAGISEVALLESETMVTTTPKTAKAIPTIIDFLLIMPLFLRPFFPAEQSHRILPLLDTLI